MRTLEEVKKAFGSDSAQLEFSEKEDCVWVKPKVWMPDGEFRSLNDFVKELGGQYVDLYRCWVIPFDAAAREDGDVGRRESEDDDAAERSRNEEKTESSSFRNFPEQPPAQPAKASDDVIVQLDPQRIHANKYNPNEMASEDFNALLENMKREKISPIEVRPIEGGQFEVIDGEHRLMAAKRLNWTSINCIVRGVDEDRASEINYAKNRLRGSINPWNEAELFYAFKAKLGTQEEVAKKFGVSLDYVHKRLTLNRIPEEIQRITPRGVLPSLLEVLARVEDPADQEKLAKKIADGITVREAETFVSKLRPPVEAPPPPLAPLAGAGVATAEPKADLEERTRNEVPLTPKDVNQGGDGYVRAELRRALGQPVYSSRDSAGAQTTGTDKGSVLGIDKGEAGGTDLGVGKSVGKSEGKEWWARYDKILPPEIVNDVNGHVEIGGDQRKVNFLRIYLGRLWYHTANLRKEVLEEAEGLLSDEEDAQRRPPS